MRPCAPGRRHLPSRSRLHHLPHRLGDNKGQALGKFYRPIQEIDLPAKAVDFFLDRVES